MFSVRCLPLFCLSPQHIYSQCSAYTLCIFVFWLIFEGRSRDKTKAIKGYEEIARSRRERTQDNVFSEGQSEITEELPVLQNKIIWNKFRENMSGGCWVWCCFIQATFNKTLFSWWDVKFSGSWAVYLRNLRWPHGRLKSHINFKYCWLRALRMGH